MKISPKQQEQIKKLFMTPAASWKYPRIKLAIPNGYHYPSDFLYVRDRMIAAHGLIPLRMPATPQIDYARSFACAVMLRDPAADALLMLDSDHEHPVEVVPRLAQWLLATKDGAPKDRVEVVGGFNFNRAPPHRPCFYVDPPEGEPPWDGNDNRVRIPLAFDENQRLIHAAILGTGSILIARTALERMAQPYFYHDYKVADMTCENAWPGEDIGFAINCRKANIPQYVDTWAKSPHQGTRMITQADYDPAAVSTSAASKGSPPKSSGTPSTSATKQNGADS